VVGIGLGLGLGGSSMRPMAAGSSSVSANLVREAKESPEKLDALPAIALQAVFEPGEKTSEGVIVDAVAIAWFAILEELKKSPDDIHRVPWRKWEEIIAVAYRADGFEVVLTDRSGDDGRDVIATRGGFGSIRILDQVKCYKPGHLVSADDVRSMLGVLEAESNASKGVISTTSGFAPGIAKNERLAKFMPYRLELRPRDELLEWLFRVSGAAKPKGP